MFTQKQGIKIFKTSCTYYGAEVCNASSSIRVNETHSQRMILDRQAVSDVIN